MTGIHLMPVDGIGEIRPGDDLAQIIHDAICGASDVGSLVDGDVVVVTQKVVSKAEGRLAPAADKQVAIAAESARRLRQAGDMIIAETRHGFVCANAGVDSSNVPPGQVALLPVDPDASARRLRSRLERLSGRRVGVVISDTFGRPWRIGQTDVAIGVAGISPFIDYRGTRDDQGRDLAVTRICIADELAAAAELAMGKVSRVCAVVVRGVVAEFGRGAATMIVRPPAEDLFR